MGMICDADVKIIDYHVISDHDDLGWERNDG
jgi:hypothetical protein